MVPRRKLHHDRVRTQRAGAFADDQTLKHESVGKEVVGHEFAHVRSIATADHANAVTEFADHLPAGAARRHRFGGRRVDKERLNLLLSRGNGLEYRIALRADRQAVRGVLDIRAAMNPAVVTDTRRADAESAVRSIGIGGGYACGVPQPGDRFIGKSSSGHAVTGWRPMGRALIDMSSVESWCRIALGSRVWPASRVVGQGSSILLLRPQEC